MAIVFIRFETRPAADPRRAPLLERMLARAQSRLPLRDWRSHAYGLLTSEPLPGLGAVALAAAADVLATPIGACDSPWVYLACPVHHTTGMASLSLSAGALLRLDGGEAQALAQDFNHVFGVAGLKLVAVPGAPLTEGAAAGEQALPVSAVMGGHAVPGHAVPGQVMSVHVARGNAGAGVATLGGSARLLLVCPGPVLAETHDPRDALEGDLWEFQPSGPDAAYLRGLMSEVEMWLFDHPVNQQRVSRGDPAITGLWLWGGGARLAALPEVRGWTAGEDPLFAAFADVSAGTPARGAARRGAVGVEASIVAGAARWPRESSVASGAAPGVVVLDVCPGTPAWEEAESRWLRPALARLRAGGIHRLELSAGQWLFRIDSRWRWRLWRKTLPWWEMLR